MPAAASVSRVPATPSFRRRVLAVGALALVVRVVYVLAWSRNAALGFDGRTYFELAKRLSVERAYLAVFDDRTEPTALFPPGFPVLLALLRLVGLTTRTRLLLGLAVLGSGTVVTIGYLGRRVRDERVGLVAAGMAAVYPNLFLAEGALMSEALVALLVALALLALLAARGAPSATRFAVAGLPLAWLAVTRSDGWLVAAALVAVTVGAARLASRRARLAAASAGLAATVALLGAWELRNALRMQAFVPVAVNSWSVVGGANCDQAYYGSRVGTWYLQCLPVARARRENMRGEIRFNRFAASRGIEYATDHLGRLPVVFAGRLGLTFGLYQPLEELDAESRSEGRSAPWSKVGFVMYVALALAAVAGTRRLWRARARRVVVLLALPAATVALSSLAAYGNQRFRMPFEPSLVVLAAVGAVRAVERSRAGRAGQSAAVACPA